MLRSREGVVTNVLFMIPRIMVREGADMVGRGFNGVAWNHKRSNPIHMLFHNPGMPFPAEDGTPRWCARATSGSVLTCAASPSHMERKRSAASNDSTRSTTTKER